LGCGASASAASGFKGLFECIADRPDGDIVEVEPVAIAGLQRLDEEPALGDLKDQRIAGGGRGWICVWP
jgi:hypothetical protein